MRDVNHPLQGERASDRVTQAVRQLLSGSGTTGAAWGKEPALTRQASLAGMIPSVEDLLRTPLLRPPYLLVMSGGRPLAQERYCQAERVITGAAVEHLIDIDLVEAELKSGAAIKFNRMELWNPQIATIAQEFARSKGKAVKVWGFLSPPGEIMFPPHRDPAHVIALQLDGRKEWRLDGPCPDGPWNSLADVGPSGEPIMFSLEPGDVLYLPYGFAHSAVATAGYSYHVTFALEGMTAGQVRTQVVKAFYDYLAGSDATEIRPDNLPGVLAELGRTLSTLADGLAAAAEHPNQLEPGQVAAVVSGLLTTSEDSRLAD